MCKALKNPETFVGLTYKHCFWFFLQERITFMTEIKLSKRLKAIANYIGQDIKKLADIGTDHAYLPCYICLNNESVYAIASDVAKGPYELAVQQVKRLNLENRIDVRLGDGLSTLHEDEVDCIVIAGMGGSLMQTILEAGLNKLHRVSRLVLQPNIDEKSVRQFAVNHQFEIVAEEILKEDDHIYEILVLEKSTSDVNLSDKQLFFGPYLLENKNNVFKEKWAEELKKKKQILNQMKRAKQPNVIKMAQFEKEAMWIEEELI